MSEVVSGFPTVQGRPPIYPWEEWMEITEVNEYGFPCSKSIKLWKDKDFNGQARSFRVLAHRTAKNYGLKVRTAIDDDGESIILEFYEPGDEE